MDWKEMAGALIFWGPGAVICGVMIFAIYKLAKFTIGKFGDKFIASQVALAESAARQAQSMEGLKESIQGFVLRDNSEHREMLVLLKYLAQEHQDRRIQREDTHEDRECRKKQAAQDCAP